MYLPCVIGCYAKYTSAKQLKSKIEAEVPKVTCKISIKFLQVDLGKEFDKQ